MKFLVDTNIFARIAQPAHVDHGSATESLAALIGDGHLACLVPQVIYEFWVVATRPVTANGLGMDALATNREIDQMLTVCDLLQDERAIYPHWRKLVTDLRVAGKRAHDARLASAMIRHGLTHVLTFNGSDFAGFSGVTVIPPHTP